MGGEKKRLEPRGEEIMKEDILLCPRCKSSKLEFTLLYADHDACVERAICASCGETSYYCESTETLEREGRK